MIASTEDIAEALVEGCRKEGGLFTHADLANWQVHVEEPVVGTYRDLDLQADFLGSRTCHDPDAQHAGGPGYAFHGPEFIPIYSHPLPSHEP